MLEHEAATARLMGAKKPDATAPDAASALYPNDPQTSWATGNSDEAETDAGADENRPQPDSVRDRTVSAFFSQHALNAIQDGDRERAGNFQAASDALIADAEKHGSSAQDLGEALQLFGEATGDHLSPEAQEERRNEALATLQQEMGPAFTTDISKAQRFIRDLDKIMPGTIASLERFGAGNDVQLIKIAVKEAKRRGY